MGLVVGLFLAPRAGRETRGIVIDQVTGLLQNRFGTGEQPETPTV
jgi:hypothetical protein